ncbi:MAG: VCBS repeat-containing protein [Bacteroidota bacterium]
MDFAAGSKAIDIELGDLDGDGKLDIVVANYGSPFISIFRNTSSSGQLSLQPARIFQQV